ncbi:MAG: Rieske 2Fe-2S domain-containing protein [Chloroflexi bacterium]|nr:Rieske 2Fe-2S domain-containing protein [Chloroflexota bacterium]
MSPALAFLGLSILGTWGLASIGLIVGGVILIFFPGNADTNSDPMVGGIVLLVAGLASGGLMQLVLGPLLGIDPPLPVKAKSIIPQAKLDKWASAGFLRDLPDGKPKEIRMHSLRVAVVRMGDRAYAMSGLCPHARLPIAGFPGSPIKAEPVQDDCVMCPLHGARFEVATGKVVRQPFSSQFNNDHPFLGRLQAKLLFFNRKAEDIQTYPVRIENGEVLVGLPK